MLNVENIHLSYGSSIALRGTSLEVAENKITCVLGRNGVGKTSLLRSIIGLEPVQFGGASYSGKQLTEMKVHDRARTGIGFLRLCAEQMAKNEPNEDAERGCVISTASIAAFEGQIGQVSYAAAKSAIAAMSFVAARDLGNIGVRVNAIAPSLFNTGLVQQAPQEMKDALVAGAAFPHRMGEPREYALLAKAIIENPMLNGGTIRLDAGQRFGPR